MFRNKARILLIGAVLFCAGYLGPYAYFKYVAPAAKEYAMRPVSASLKNLQTPSLPNISVYTVDAIMAKIPQIVEGEVKVIAPSASASFMKMAAPREEIVGIMASKQQAEKPVLIEIISGVYTLESLEKALANPAYLEKTASGYSLKVPLLIADNATLVVQGTKELKQTFRLSEDSGAFISVFGKFFAVHADIIGWSLVRNEPAIYVSKEKFRPALVFWSNSGSYIVRSAIRHLGFAFPKMYGISYSSDVNTREKHSNINSSALLIESYVEDLYYGVYTYEFNNFIALRNEFKDNIVYGIDPHDRSSRLIVAYNNVHGTKEKHGIIFSRDVNDSWIFGNYSHHNKGSGIMLDRNCSRNFVSKNILENNDGDGLAFFESPNNISYENEINNNDKAGIRIRNSWDLKLLKDKIHDNSGYALLAYALLLETEGGESDGPRKARDVKLDPYGMRAAFDIVDAEINNNTAGNFNFMDIERVGLYNLSIFKSPGGYFSGDGNVEDLQQQLFGMSGIGGSGVELHQLDYTPKYSEFWNAGEKSSK